MPKYLSNKYAPYSTCPICGWSGRDWGFKYRSLCKRCHAKWRKEKAKESQEDKLLIKNIEIANGIVVTEHVHKRLWQKAKRQIGVTKICKYVRLSYLIIFYIAMWVSFYLNEYVKQIADDNFSVIIKIVVYLLATVVCGVFEYRLHYIIANETVKLARIRQLEIQEKKRFYNSAEWRLIREQVIQDKGCICQECGRRILNDYDLTVDHIKPRSKFPELALEKSNLQILCRNCNSSKGATHDESSLKIDEGFSFADQTKEVE